MYKERSIVFYCLVGLLLLSYLLIFLRFGSPLPSWDRCCLCIIMSLFLIRYPFFIFSLILAIVDTSSTILFYEIGSGLVEPRVPSHKEVEQMKRVPVWNEQKGKWKIF